MTALMYRMEMKRAIGMVDYADVARREDYEEYRNKVIDILLSIGDDDGMSKKELKKIINIGTDPLESVLKVLTFEALLWESDDGKTVGILH